MAQEIRVTITDDINGKEGAETIAFAFDGLAYEIDLDPENAYQLREALAPYVGAARKLSQAKSASKLAPAKAYDTADNGSIRKWAAEQGLDVPARGRIPGAVREAWELRYTVAGKENLAMLKDDSAYATGAATQIKDADWTFAAANKSAASTKAIEVIRYARNHGGVFPEHRPTFNSDSVTTLIRKGFGTRVDDKIAHVNGAGLALLEQWETAQAAKAKTDVKPSAPHMSAQRTDLPADKTVLPHGKTASQWKTRQAAGLVPVEGSTDEQIFAALSRKHVEMLKRLVEGVPCDKISNYSTSAVTLRNLGVVGFDDKITPRGVDALTWWDKA
jgi:hypothetical protein